MPLSEKEELELLELEKEKAGVVDEKPVDYKYKNAYENIPDEQLNIAQRAERKLEEMGLVKPGHEIFAPGAMEQKFKNAASELGLLGATGAAIATGPAGLVTAAKNVGKGAAMGAGYGLLRKLGIMGH